MPRVNPAVKAAQQLIAELGETYTAAAERLARAERRRADTLARVDEEIRQARAEVDAALRQLAERTSPELAATITGRPVAEVRRLIGRRAPRRTAPAHQPPPPVQA